MSSIDLERTSGTMFLRTFSVVNDKIKLQIENRSQNSQKFAFRFFDIFVALKLSAVMWQNQQQIVDTNLLDRADDDLHK